MRGWVRGRWLRTSSGRSLEGSSAVAFAAASCGSREGGSPEMTDKTAAELDAERVAIDRRLEEIRQLLGPVMREAGEAVPDLSGDERAELEKERVLLQEKREQVVFLFDVVNEKELGLQRAE